MNQIIIIKQETFHNSWDDKIGRTSVRKSKLSIQLLFNFIKFMEEQLNLQISLQDLLAITWKKSKDD